MGESANTAFYAIVYAKRLVPPDRLQKALNKAMLEGLPLEKVVVGTGLLSPQECQSILRMRSQLGRVCRDCGETTYLLPDQDEASTPCEFCGGRFLSPSRRTPPPQARPGTNPRSVQRAPTGRHSAPASGPTAEQLAKFREQVVGEALKAVETKFAQEDLQGTLNRLVQEAVTRVSLQVGQQVGQQINTQLAQQVGQQIGPLVEQRMGQLNQQLHDQVGEGVRRELESLQIDSLESRVTNQALRAIQESAPAESGSSSTDVQRAVNDAVAQLRAEFAQQLAEAGGGGDTAELEAQVNSLANRLTQAQQNMLGSDVEQQISRLDDRVSQAITSMKQGGGDMGALVERIGLLEASQGAQAESSSLDPLDVKLMVQEQLASFDVDAIARRAAAEVVREGGGGSSGGLDADEVTELAQRQARHAAQEVVTDVVKQQLAAIDLSGGNTELEGEISSLRADLAQVAERGTSSDDVLGQVAALRHEVEAQLASLNETVEAQVQAGIEGSVERIANEAALKAAKPIRKSVEIQLADLDLPNLAERIRQQVESGMGASSSMSSSGSVDVDAVVKKVMNQVETRLAEFDMAAEMAIQDAGRQALEAVESRLSRLEEHSNEGNALGEGTRATLERLEHEQRALTKHIRVLQKKLKEAGGGGGDVDVDALVEQVAERVGGGAAADPAALEAQIAEAVQQALAAQGDTCKQSRRASRAAEAVREDMQTLRSELSASLEEFTEWADGRFTALEAASGDGGGEGAAAGTVSADQLEDILGAARAAAEALVEERTAGGTPLESAVPAKGQTGSYNKKFVALAREVKHLKDKVESTFKSPSEERRTERESGRSVVNSQEFKSLLEVRLKAAIDKKLGDTGTFRTTTSKFTKPTGQPDEAAAVGLLNSVEFKSMFDTKINEVLRYLKMDLVPSLVKRTMREVESQ